MIQATARQAYRYLKDQFPLHKALFEFRYCYNVHYTILAKERRPLVVETAHSFLSGEIALVSSR